MRCIIIDDEPNAIDVLQRYADRIEFIEIIATFRNPAKALRLLHNEKTDLLFIDINMPELTGLQLLNSLSFQPLLIFTTAYAQYAVESYNYNAVDYLVKPISFERFVKAVNKAFEQFQLRADKETTRKIGTTLDNKEVVLLKSGTQLHRLNKNDILFFEKDSNYIIVHTPDKKILIRGNMADVYGLVSANDFFQLHKSFIVNLSLIEMIEVHQVTIKGRKIPIGQTFREAFLKRIQK